MTKITPEMRSAIIAHGVTYEKKLIKKRKARLSRYRRNKDRGFATFIANLKKGKI